MVNVIAPDVPVQSTPRVCSAKLPKVDHDSAWAGNETMPAYRLHSRGCSWQRTAIASTTRASGAATGCGGPASAAAFIGNAARAKSRKGNDICMGGSLVGRGATGDRSVTATAAHAWMRGGTPPALQPTRMRAGKGQPAPDGPAIAASIGPAPFFHQPVPS